MISNLVRLPRCNLSVVMATGILSIAAAEEDGALVSTVLLLIGVLAFAVVVAIEVHRAFAHSKAVRTELTRPQTAFDLFTWVAAFGVLGQRLRGLEPLESVFWAAGIAGWLGAAAAVRRSLQLRPRGWSSHAVAGTWLLSVVGPQSLAVLGSSIADERKSVVLLATSLCFFGLGLALYALTIALIVRRLLAGEVGPPSLTPDYWIMMGALAISTLAATHLARSVAVLGGTSWAGSLLTAAALAAWAAASTWIPYLVAAEVVRAAILPSVLRDVSGRWSTVFPLGMYSVATHSLAGAPALTVLDPLAKLFFWTGLVAWLLTAAGAVYHLLAAPKRGAC